MTLGSDGQFVPKGILALHWPSSEVDPAMGRGTRAPATNLEARFAVAANPAIYALEGTDILTASTSASIDYTSAKGRKDVVGRRDVETFVLVPEVQELSAPQYPLPVVISAPLVFREEETNEATDFGATGEPRGPYYGGAHRRRFFIVPPASDPEHARSSGALEDVDARAQVVTPPVTFKSGARNALITSESFLSADNGVDALRAAISSVLENASLRRGSFRDQTPARRKLEWLSRLDGNRGPVITRVLSVLESQLTTEGIDDRLQAQTEIALGALSHPDLNASGMVGEIIAGQMAALQVHPYDLKKIKEFRRQVARRVGISVGAAGAFGAAVLALSTYAEPLVQRFAPYLGFNSRPAVTLQAPSTYEVPTANRITLSAEPVRAEPLPPRRALPNGVVIAERTRARVSGTIESPALARALNAPVHFGDGVNATAIEEVPLARED